MTNFPLTYPGFHWRAPMGQLCDIADRQLNGKGNYKLAGLYSDSPNDIDPMNTRCVSVCVPPIDVYLCVCVRVNAGVRVRTSARVGRRLGLRVLQFVCLCVCVCVCVRVCV